ncbi:MAG: hypothetical protein QOH01_251 [Verrucomicrobiota bacterium]|jgi:hypothetical protein
MSFSSCLNPKRHRAGVAIVIVLAFVVLLAVMVVAFLSRTSVDRQIAHSDFNSVRSDELARSALDIVVGDLKQEIVNGSTPSTVNNVTIYAPSSASNIVPQAYGTPTSGTPIPNLIRRSIRSDTPGAPAVDSRASALGSAPSPSGTPAKLGDVTTARWNKHYLIPKADTGNDLADPVSSFTAPDWVFVTQTGPTVISGPSGTVTGRYAYAIYNEGGLLDVNVAGYPIPTPAPAVSPPQPYAFKGSLAYADLNPSSGVNISALQINNIVGWRNYATTRPSGDFSANFDFTTAAAQRYFNWISSNTTGFLSVRTDPSPSPYPWTGRTDQSFVTRQQLLSFRRATGFSVNALQYLGTFSRELNSPSVSPVAATATNPDFAQARATTAFARFDGSTATSGEPLVKTRFPLSRLAWITYKGPSSDVYSANPSDAVITNLLTNNVSVQTIQAGTAGNILKCFGLAYVSNDLWKYSHGAPNRILTLSEVATAGREPDYFELLQAGILVGSLGQNTGGGVTPSGSTVFPDVHMSSTTHHVLSIGAAIIDQADPDSIPTIIQYTPAGVPWTASGVESLPYITEMYALAGTSPNDSTKWATYLVFQLWNPHQNIPSPPTVRLRVDGGLGLFKGGNGETWTNSGSNFFYNATGLSITLNAGALFGPSPAPLSSANATLTSPPTATGQFVALPTPPASASGNPGAIVGFRLPDYSYPSPAPTPTSTPTVCLQIGAATGPSLAIKNTFNATLEVDIGGGTFVAYNRFIGINDATSWITDDAVQLRTANSRNGSPRAFTASQWTQIPPPVFMKADPRSTRFGPIQTSALTSNPSINESLWPSSASLPNGYGGNIADPGGAVEHAPMRFSSLPYLPATLALNTTSSNTRTSYADNDGVTRPADSAYPEPTPVANSTPRYSTPYFPASTPVPSPTPPANVTLEFNDYQPIVLNRPFKSVAELGYAFRDLPWKTLDFFTDNSGDSALLDIFSITDEPQLVAGRVSLNTRQVPVLQSILAGALVSELECTNTVSKTGSGATAAPVIATNLVSATSSAPLRNKAELISRAGLPTTILPVPASGSAHDQRVKVKREVVPRALASVTETRTWNLLIDVIAQSGRFPPTATALTDFVTQGEKRYWLHVAIDRFTGEVVDQQLEAVYE